jgi:RNA polymerase sigma factor
MQVVFINERVEKIKNDQQEINRFVEEYKPFIASCTEKATGRYVRYGEDDELSIALMAFVEAINSYDSSKGNFLSFAQSVIKRRIIDYYRKEKKHFNVISISDYAGEEDEDIDLSVNESLDRFSINQASEYRRMEIEDLKKELAAWDISFFELTESSPKHTRTRKMCNDIIGYLLAHNDLVSTIRRKKFLPVAEIEKALRIPRKKIERSRRYIIAVIIVMTGDYQYIKDYVSWGGG